MSSALTTVEQRSGRRYPVRLPVKFLWKSASGALDQGLGYSHDISLKGAYVQAEVAPPLGAEVQCEVDVASPFHPGRGTQLLSHGTVLRCDGQGFAVSTERQFGMGRRWQTRDATRDSCRQTAGFAAAGKPGPKTSKHI